ncbi:MAG TPA: hypothetical protein VGB37_16955 [Candidatus Lokiarchaeia archaeon]
MKWFKHSVDSHDDPDISDAEDLFGDAGYVIFFKLLELYAREYNNTNSKGKLSFSSGFLKRKLRKSLGKVEQILNFYQEKQRIFFEKYDGGYTIIIPKFIDIMDNWGKRVSNKTPELLQSENGVTTQSIRIKNKEVEVEVDKELRKESKEKVKNTFSFVETSIEFQLSKKLLDLILINNPNFKKPDLQKWAIEIDKTIRIDKRNPEEIKNIIEWSQDDSFWRSNILSTAKLRKQFDHLLIKMNLDNERIL